jgi:hypothetical protein
MLLIKYPLETFKFDPSIDISANLARCSKRVNAKNCSTGTSSSSILLRCPHGDSNPSFGLERATSWASRRWGHSAKRRNSTMPPRLRQRYATQPNQKVRLPHHNRTFHTHQAEFHLLVRLRKLPPSSLCAGAPARAAGSSPPWSWAAPCGTLPVWGP